jgi:hypothetical protein
MPTDEIIKLQCAAREVARLLIPGTPLGHVVVYDILGKPLFRFPIPIGLRCDGADTPAVVELPGVTAGWAVGPKGALYDGEQVRVAPSRLRLLKALVEAGAPVAAKELAKSAFTSETDEGNCRYHVGELRKELKAHFPDFDADIIRPTGSGYELVLR